MIQVSVPVLWLCGPPGVGKTAVAFELYRQLASSNVAAAYVDIDQLGMCFPELSADPDRHRLKARNLDAAVRCFAAAGARCVIVSGVVHSTAGAPAVELPEAELTVVRLRADARAVADRFLARAGQPEMVEAVLREADELEASDFADACVDTTDFGVGEVVEQVRETIAAWPPPRARHDSSPKRPRPVETIDGRTVVFLHGAPGVGKSTIGFGLFQRVLGTGATAAYVDADQLRFCSTATTTELRARALAAVWSNFRAGGAGLLVAVGRVGNQRTAQTFAHALRTSTTTWVHLTVEPRELRTRILRRGERASWAEPGDELLGRSQEELLRIAESASADAVITPGPGARIDTTGLSAAEAVERVSAEVQFGP